MAVLGSDHLPTTICFIHQEEIHSYYQPKFNKHSSFNHIHSFQPTDNSYLFDQEIYTNNYGYASLIFNNVEKKDSEEVKTAVTKEGYDQSSLRKKSDDEFTGDVKQEYNNDKLVGAVTDNDREYKDPPRQEKADCVDTDVAKFNKQFNKLLRDDNGRRDLYTLIGR